MLCISYGILCIRNDVQFGIWLDFSETFEWEHTCKRSNLLEAPYSVIVSNALSLLHILLCMKKKTEIKFESPTLIEIHVAIVYAITENKHHIHVTLVDDNCIRWSCLFYFSFLPSLLLRLLLVYLAHKPKQCTRSINKSGQIRWRSGSQSQKWSLLEFHFTYGGSTMREYQAKEEERKKTFNRIEFGKVTTTYNS